MIAKRLYFFIAFLISTVLSLQAQNNGIRFFKGSWAELQAQAKQQNKPFFIDCYTSWCGPCHRMAEEVFTKKEAGDFYNQNFIAYQLDMEHDDGRTVGLRYDVEMYPTYLFFNPQGELIHKTMGYKSAESFIHDGRTALDANNSLYGLAKRFKSGDRDTTMLKKLINLANYNDKDLCEQALEGYWEAIPEKDYIKPENWNIFNSTEQDINAKAYKYVESHKADFVKAYGEGNVNNALLLKANASIEKAAQTKDEATFKKAKTIIMASDNESMVNEAEYCEILFDRNTGRWNEYIKNADAYLLKHPNDESIYKAFAEYILSTDVKDRKVLNKALDYATQSASMQKTYQNTAAQAEALYRLGRMKEAEATANESITISKSVGADYSDITKLLEKIRGGK
jgi:thioredoxin-related protein